ncbi:phosphotransferase [Shewanella sp. 3_MG-2023]|uniref:phosphotransferase n=1 Tax=Shewanella sp. 3_MG-2023 TaxID=3062635 RepID=UPI0026E2A0BA|nr:phosphotransferase [Shewanella sp. 3_MG-2023]MDO6775490.1 phosphotransferase [Shewanella sp. 3_MG-2023]
MTSPIAQKRQQQNQQTPHQLPLQTWQAPDWPNNANLWVKAVLIGQNIEPIDDLVAVKCWSLGQVLKQATTQGDVYFKATAHLPLFSNEAKLCQKLGQLFPQQSAQVIAIDEAKQWMLTQDFGNAYEETVPLAVWAEAFSSFAQLQISSSEHIGELASSGCLVRDIQDLPQQLTSIFNDDSILARLPEAILHPQQYQAILTALDNAIRALKQFKLPNTLVHSDLHIENIAKVKGECVFFDWSDGCISHPFIDGTYLFRMQPSADKHAVINAYLSQWTHLHSIEQLNQAWNIAEVVCYAHQAVSYAQMINQLPPSGIEDLQTAFENAIKRLFDKVLIEA